MDTQVAEKIEHRVVQEVSKFTGIKEGAAADLAMLEPDVRLFEIDHSNQWYGAARTEDPIDEVPCFSRFTGSRIEGSSAFFCQQLIFLKLVEPKPFTAAAPVDFDARELNGKHGRDAFGT